MRDSPSKSSKKEFKIEMDDNASQEGNFSDSYSDEKSWRLSNNFKKKGEQQKQRNILQSFM